MPDDARRFDQTAGMHHAAHRLCSRNRRRDRAVRIDRRQPLAGEIAAEPVAEPPWHAVHRCQHDRLRVQQRCDMRGHRRHGRTLDRHHDEVLHAEIRRLFARLDLHGVRHAAFDQTQAMLLQRIERRAARHHAHVVAGLRKLHPHPATDRAGTVDSYFHRFNPCVNSRVNLRLNVRVNPRVNPYSSRRCDPRAALTRRIHPVPHRDADRTAMRRACSGSPLLPAPAARGPSRTSPSGSRTHG